MPQPTDAQRAALARLRARVPEEENLSPDEALAAGLRSLNRQRARRGNHPSGG